MIINFSMDFLSLYITARLMHIKLKNIRITTSSFIGALYSLFVLALNLTEGVSLFLSISVSFVMTLVAFGKQRAKDIIKNTFVFYLISFALGGGITAICNLLNIWQNNRQIMINGTFDVLYGDVPFGIFVVLAVLCGIFSVIGGKLVKKKNATRECSLEITLGNNRVTLKALIDSGNLLKEPISEKPVIIATFECIRKILPIEMLNIFKTKNITANEPYEYFSKIRIIPASSIGNKAGLLLAFYPDSTKVDGKEVDVYLAVDSSSKDFAGFSAIVPNIIL